MTFHTASDLKTSVSNKKLKLYLIFTFTNPETYLCLERQQTEFKAQLLWKPLLKEMKISKLAKENQ